MYNLDESHVISMVYQLETADRFTVSLFNDIPTLCKGEEAHTCTCRFVSTIYKLPSTLPSFPIASPSMYVTITIIHPCSLKTTTPQRIQIFISLGMMLATQIKEDSYTLQIAKGVKYY